MSIDLYLDETTPVPDTLPLGIILGKKLPSSGVHSKIYEATISGNTGYIGKVIPISINDRPNCPSDFLLVKSELIITQEMSNKGIGPKVHAIALTRTEGTIVMDRYEGNLAELLLLYQKNKNLSLDPILTTVRKLITNMHINGIIHRDLIPANILYRNDGTFVIADYGLAIRSNMFREDDWKFYDSLVALIELIEKGEQFKSIKNINTASFPEGVEPLTLIWKGNECQDWQ